MYRYMYTFHRAEVAREIGEWWPQLDTAARKLGRSVRWEKNKSQLPRLMTRFQNAVVAMRKAVNILGEEMKVTDEGWWEVRSLMAVVAAQTNVLVGRWDECENWGVGFRGL